MSLKTSALGLACDLFYLATAVFFGYELFLILKVRFGIPQNWAGPMEFFFYDQYVLVGSFIAAAISGICSVDWIKVARTPPLPKRETVPAAE